MRMIERETRKALLNATMPDRETVIARQAGIWDQLQRTPRWRWRKRRSLLAQMRALGSILYYLQRRP